MSLVGLRKELTARGWHVEIMNLNENRRVRSPEYIDVQNGWDYFRKVLAHAWRGYAIHVRVNGETKKGYALALCALLLARLFRRPALLTYGGGHQQSYFPAPKHSFRHIAFSFLFRFPHRIFCNSDKVKEVLLTTGIPASRVVPIPHFSTYYVQFTPTALPEEVERFFQGHEGVFFSYVCFRKEFALPFLAEAIRRFRKSNPKIGFFWVGPWGREMEPMHRFLQEERIEDAVMVQGSAPHEMFLNMMSRSLAYIRTPVTDGICSSVLESLKLKVPVLGADNGTRPPGTELWNEGNVDSLLRLMNEAVDHHREMVARIPEIPIEDNAKKLADSIEDVCGHFSGFSSAEAFEQRREGAAVGEGNESRQGQSATGVMREHVDVGVHGRDDRVMKSQQTIEAVEASPLRRRNRAPVFVIGCGRSGTTLLYHMILSAGNFAVYRTESNAINLLEPRFGDLSKEGNKRRLLQAWYESRLYTASGLDRAQIGKKVMDEVHNGGDFLRVVMEEICRQQGMERWAECTPEHILHLDRIKQTIPDALVVHIIRDGRDVSLSMEKGHWIRPFPWQKKSNLNISGLYWEWMVNKGQQDGRRLGDDYTEVRFEELVSSPRETLAKLGEFIDHDLDYDRIREVGIGSVSEPNSSFKPASSQEKFNPVGRWKQKLSAAELRTFEGLVGRTLTVLGYPLATNDWNSFEKSKLDAVRTGYRAVFDSKLWLKAKTPLGPLFTTRNLDWI